MNEPRARARLAALQALYQMEIGGADPDDVIDEFIVHRLAEGGPTDQQFFTDIIRGVIKHQVEIDRALAGALAEGWKLERIDSILRALLRSASYELIGRADVPAKVVIDEYVELARDFFDGDEPKFVNAVLDRLAREKRAAEFDSHPSTRSG